MKNDIREALEVKSAASGPMRQALELWSAMYEDLPPWQSETVKTLSLPAGIASEMARLVTLELKSTLSGSARADYLNGPYQALLRRLRPYVEYACAKGGLVLKPYFDGEGIAVDCVQSGDFFPTAFDGNGKVMGAVFVDRVAQGKKFFTRLEQASFCGGVYTVKNEAYVSDSPGYLGAPVALEEVAQWAHLQEETLIHGLKAPLFTYFKMPLANAVDEGSPLGVSVYARAVDLIAQADRQYSRLLWEFESGERALYVSDEAFRRDKDGRLMLPDKRLYRSIATFGGGGLFEDWSPPLRQQEILSGLNALLQKIEFSCGLAYGTLSDVNYNEKTAEEIRASKQRSYAAVTDIQKALQGALEELTRAMDALCTLYGLAPEGKVEAAFEFDDSIVADRKAEFDERVRLVQLGAMAPWEIRMWYLGEPEDVAREAAGEQMQ